MSAIIARIERIRSGHSERALVHAIDAEGREYKIEVPTSDVRELAPGQAYLLVMSWSIHASPLAPTITAPAASAPEPTTTAAVATAAAAAPTAAPSSVDAQFMALMSRTSSEPARASQSPQGGTPDQQLASLLGMPRDSLPTT